MYSAGHKIVPRQSLRPRVRPGSSVAECRDEHFYHLALLQFGAFHRLKLDPPPPLRELLTLAAEAEDLTDAGLTVERVVQRIEELLMEKREMMDEYFSLRISADGLVETLPMVLVGYTPDLDRLPHFLLCLGTQVRYCARTC